MKSLKINFQQNKKKIFVVLTAILLVTLFVLTVCVFAPQIRKPKYVKGNIFDEKVQNILINDWLEKPKGALNESFSSSYNKDVEQFYYTYTCYTQEPLTSYAKSVQQKLIERQGVDIIVGSLEKALLEGGVFVLGNGVFSEADESYLTYSAVYTNILQRRFIKGMFLSELCVCAMYTRSIRVVNYLVPSENGLYQTVVSFSVDKNGKNRLVYSKDNNKTVRKFIKFI